MSANAWQALVLAAGRGPDDPMAKAYGVSHKCLIPVGGVPMLRWVVATLLGSAEFSSIRVSIDSVDLAAVALGPLAGAVDIIPARESAARSASAALADARFPQLITTGDHPLLTEAMIDHFLGASLESGADLTAGLATRDTIEAAFPDAKRTYLRFAERQVSGCNLFALATPRARAALDFWHHIERVRKKPWRLASAFGPVALIRYATGTLTLDGAFRAASQRLGIRASAVLMPFAEAAVDVDKTSDKELAETILRRRSPA